MADLPTAVLCTPIDIERAAVLDLLPGRALTDAERDGVQYRRTELQGRRSDWNLVLAMGGRGNERAAAAVEHALASWSPRILVLCGVAGGLRDAAVGDVVAATKVYGYESGEDTDAGRLPRPDALPTSFSLHQLAMLLVEKGEWAARLGTEAPRVFHRPIASGAKVVTGRRSETARLIALHSGDAQALDTESHGAMAAAARRSGVEAIVVRGVSDLVDGKNKADDLRDQPRAARNAAALALALIEHAAPGTAPAKDRHGTTYIGALGAGARAHIAAMGPNAKGSIIVRSRDQFA
jgi:nucleoside phosphorylase